MARHMRVDYRDNRRKGALDRLKRSKVPSTKVMWDTANGTKLVDAFHARVKAEIATLEGRLKHLFHA